MTVGSQQQSMATVRETAALWIVRLHDANATEKAVLQQQCDAWLAEDPLHRTVFMQMNQMWDAASDVRGKKVRSRPLLSLAWVALLLAGLSWFLPWQYWAADYRTAIGEVKTITLEDGSQLILNSNSAVSVAYAKEVRSVQLIAGEILAIVEKDSASRPFQIINQDGTATALGTRYSVRQFSGHSRAAVQESSIAVSSAHTQNQQVPTGYALDYSNSGTGRIEPIAPEMFAWTTQRLIFVNQPLSEVIAELSRYHKGFLHLNFADQQTIPYFTGILPTNDPDAALNLLAQSLALEVTRVTPYLVFISVS